MLGIVVIIIEFKYTKWIICLDNVCVCVCIIYSIHIKFQINRFLFITLSLFKIYTNGIVHQKFVRYPMPFHSSIIKTFNIYI